MIKAQIFKKSQSYIGFEVVGHAEFDTKGKDIVCAAVSTLAQTTAISIKKMLHLDADIKVDEGYLKVIFPQDLTLEQQQKIDLLTEHMIIGLKEIQNQYDKYISIEVIYKKGGGFDA